MELKNRIIVQERNIYLFFIPSGRSSVAGFLIERVGCIPGMRQIHFFPLFRRLVEIGNVLNIVFQIEPCLVDVNTLSAGHIVYFIIPLFCIVCFLQAFDKIKIPGRIGFVDPHIFCIVIDSMKQYAFFGGPSAVGECVFLFQGFRDLRC